MREKKPGRLGFFFMKLFDFYDPTLCKSMKQLEVLHLLNKYESHKGIIHLDRDGTIKHSGVSDNEVLKKMILYHTSKGHKIRWFYITDLQAQEQQHVTN